MGKEKFVKYVKGKDYISAIGRIYTSEDIKRDHPMVEKITCVLKTDESETMFYQIEPLVRLKSDYGIGIDVGEEESIKKINELYNKNQEEQRKSEKENILKTKKKSDLKEREILALEKRNELKEKELSILEKQNELKEKELLILEKQNELKEKELIEKSSINISDVSDSDNLNGISGSNKDD